MNVTISKRSRNLWTKPKVPHWEIGLVRNKNRKKCDIFYLNEIMFTHTDIKYFHFNCFYIIINCQKKYIRLWWFFLPRLLSIQVMIWHNKQFIFYSVMLFQLLYFHCSSPDGEQCHRRYFDGIRSFINTKWYIERSFPIRFSGLHQCN